MTGGTDDDGRPKPGLHQLRTLNEAGDADGAPARLSTGQTFGQRYVVEDAIGEGGAGVVYRAMDQLTRRVIALKLLESRRGADALERLLAEALIARDIRHPNIVAVYDVGAFDGRPFIIMEHLSGQTLRRWMSERLRADADISFALAREIILAIADGLEAAHAQNIVHRDLKPENVFLIGEPEEGRVRLKLLDFGLARLVGGGASGLSSAATTGTPYYMAPEQITAPDTVRPSADFYSLSVLFYELLVGVLPQGYWQPPSRGRDDVPASVDRLIENGLSNRPRMRPQSAAEFRACLSIAPAASSSPGPATEIPIKNPASGAGVQYLLRMGDAAYEKARLAGDGDQSEALAIYMKGVELGDVACMMKAAMILHAGPESDEGEEKTEALLLMESAASAGAATARGILGTWAAEAEAEEYAPAFAEDGQGVDLLGYARRAELAARRRFSAGERDLAWFFWDRAYRLMDCAVICEITGAQKAIDAHLADPFGDNFKVEDEEDDDVPADATGPVPAAPQTPQSAIEYRQAADRLMKPDAAGNPIDVTSASLYYEIAAKGGDPIAMLATGLLLYPTGDHVMAVTWVALAADRGEKEAARQLGEWAAAFQTPGAQAENVASPDIVASWLDSAYRSFALARTGSKHYGDARSIYERAANAGDPRGMAGLAYMGRSGLGLLGRARRANAEKWLARALATDYRAAGRELARLHELWLEATAG